MNKGSKEFIKLCLKLTGYSFIIILSIGFLCVYCEILMQPYWNGIETCEEECSELNLTLKEANYKGFLMQELESCDCELPAYIRVKVRT